MEVLRLRTHLLLIAIMPLVLLTGCEANSAADKLTEAGSIIKDVSEGLTGKEDTLKVEDLLENVSKALMTKDNDEIIKYFSKSMIDKYGEENIRSRLEAAEELITGDYIEELCSHTGGEGTRGGKGADIENYEIELKTSADRYVITICWSNGDSTNGFSGEYYEASRNLLYLGIYPDKLVHDADGELDIDYMYKLKEADSCVYYPEKEL